MPFLTQFFQSIQSETLKKKRFLVAWVQFLRADWVHVFDLLLTSVSVKQNSLRATVYPTRGFMFVAMITTSKILDPPPWEVGRGLDVNGRKSSESRRWFSTSFFAFHRQLAVLSCRALKWIKSTRRNLPLFFFLLLLFPLKSVPY